mgnify:CR=1 FL=1|tara:strand:- start:568 stop:744 length:177 start_codon:yes stop_codon:yes gene_type:complete
MSTAAERKQWLKDINKVAPGATKRINEQIRKPLGLTPLAKKKGASNEDQFSKDNTYPV